MRDYAEIVKALRLCSAVNSSCEECPCNDPADDLCECANKVSIAAADAIENLLTENAVLRRMIGNLTSAQAVMVKEFEGKMEELHDSKSELSAAVAERETLQKAVEKQRWVSVKDRLPEGERFLAINKWGRRFLAQRSPRADKDWLVGGLQISKDVLFWMPLPEKPRRD